VVIGIEDVELGLGDGGAQGEGLFGGGGNGVGGGPDAGFCGAIDIAEAPIGRRRRRWRRRGVVVAKQNII